MIQSTIELSAMRSRQALVRPAPVRSVSDDGENRLTRPGWSARVTAAAAAVTMRILIVVARSTMPRWRKIATVEMAQPMKTVREPARRIADKNRHRSISCQRTER